MTGKLQASLAGLASHLATQLACNSLLSYQKWDHRTRPSLGQMQMCQPPPGKKRLLSAQSARLSCFKTKGVSQLGVDVLFIVLKVCFLPAGAALVGGVKPAVKWYDARQRCGLRILAAWLKVPWKMVVNFECLLVYRLLLPPEEASKAKHNPWDQGIRAAKIGAASLGIGAIFALTGDSPLEFIGS